MAGDARLPAAGKPRQRTRERIVETSLALFNRFGEPNVTTGLIADELDISPGNLYYHFHSKDEITNTLFAAFAREMDRVLTLPAARPANVEDMWLFLHLLFELIWRYRFFYRDLNDLLSRNRTLEVQFKRLLERKVATGVALCEGLVAGGQMRAGPAAIHALSANMAMVMIYWLSFEYVRNPRNLVETEVSAHGAHQAMALVEPYLVGDARLLFERLRQRYLAAAGTAET
jgi:AcrR family transcriptional regulator